MNRHLAYYTLWDQADWPHDIARLAPPDCEDKSTIYFEDGSPEDVKFQNAIQRSRLSVTRGLLWQSTGDDLVQHPYHYLSAVEIRDYAVQSSMDTSRACGGRHPKLLPCMIGAVQVKKIGVDYSAHPDLDVFLLPWRGDKKHYVFSRRMVEAFNKQGLVGHRFVPCLSTSRSYSEEEWAFEYTSPRMLEEAEFFQLVVDAETAGTPTVGRLLSLISQCPKCLAYYGYLSEHRPYFAAHDITDADFQTFRRLMSEGGAKFHEAKETLIISAKVLKTLLTHNAKGLREFLVLPPIEHGVVEIAR